MPTSVQEYDVDLDAGKEWHSSAIRLRAGDVVTLTCTSRQRFYAGFFSRVEYTKRKGSVGGAFDFLPGSDRRAFTARVQIDSEDDYYIVLRVGIFNYKQSIHVRYIRERPGTGG